MSIRVGSQPQYPIRKLSGAAAVLTPWVRPSDWPAMTPIPEGTQKVQGLYAVFDTTTEKVAFTCAGAYTVDWGDGSATEDIATGVAAEHAYTYSTLATSVTSRGYKTALITITPQSGQNLTSINLTTAYTGATTSTKSSQWLDLELRVPNCTTLTISDSSTRKALLEQCWIREHASTTMAAGFQNCFLLQSVPLFDTSTVTTMSYMFNGCYSLKSVPLFDTSSVTTMTGMFYNCFSLQSMPLFDTSAVTTMEGMFTGCASLLSVPLFDTSAVTTMSYMFNGCSSLLSVPLFDTSAVTTMTGMFYNCFSLQSMPLFDTSSVTTMSYMFYNCFSLRSMPLFDTSAVTTMTGMFYNCFLLQSVPLFDTSAVTTMADMFYNCYSLQSVPAFDMSAVNAAATNMATNCHALGRFLGTGLRYATTFLNGELSASAINEIFTNLGTAVGSQTITVTGNPGAATCTQSIATGKGWTVAV